MKQLTLWFSLALLLPYHGVQGQTFSAFVSKNKVTVGEMVQLTFRLENARGENIKYPDLSDFQVLGGPSIGQTTQIVNGQMSQSFTYSFYLRPMKAGTFTIGSATVQANGETQTSDPITLEVVAGASNTTPDANVQESNPSPSKELMDEIRQSVFVRSIPSKTQVYEGEQISVTYKLYTRASLADLSLSESPAYKNFWVEDLDVGQGQYQQEVYQGVNYRTAIIKKVILFPQRSGKLAIDPLKLETLVRVKVQNQRRPRSIFDDFFDDPFFGSYKDVTYEFSSGPLNIHVKPLPAQGKPAPSVAVGNFTLSSSLDRPETETGEPVTLSIRIQGEGNLKTIQDPVLDFPPDFEVYDPKVADRSSTANNRVSGSKKFDYLIVPRNPGEYKLPILEFHYFDPEREQYRTLTSDSYVLKVTGEAQPTSVSLGNFGKEDIELIGEDIRFIDTENTGLNTRDRSFIGSWTFWALFGSPLLLFLFFWVGFRRKEARAQDVAGTRSRKATKMAKKRLKKAGELMAQQDRRGFFDEVSKTLWGYLGDKLNLGQSELSRENVKGKLLEKGVPEGWVIRVEQLIDHCDVALFAPASDQTRMEDTYDSAQQLIIDMEQKML